MLLTNNIDSTYRILSSIFNVPSYVFLPFSLFLLSFLDILRLFIISHTLAVCNVLCKSIKLDLNKAAVPAITRKLHITHCKSAADIIWKHPATSRKANIYFSSLELSNAGWAIQQQGQQQWGRVRAKTEQTHQGAALDPALELWSRISKRMRAEESGAKAAEKASARQQILSIFFLWKKFCSQRFISLLFLTSLSFDIKSDIGHVVRKTPARSELQFRGQRKSQEYDTEVFMKERLHTVIVKEESK